MSIFIQIAAYRDPELLPTIRDCLAMAKYPRDLRFGVCWQRDEGDHCLDAFRGDARFTVDPVPWQESKGLCWARAGIQNLYQGEDFTLQLDSHHRFAQDWDETLIRFMELTGSARPILTSYAGMYEPATNRKLNTEPYKMVSERFTPSGTILFRPSGIEGWEDLSKPAPARFVSGHFFFTLGAHCNDYKYDPDLYFAGDEISLSIRSFTLGYDLFHPHRTVVWHEYTREGRVKHWDDHTVKNKPVVEMAWHERDAISKRRLRKMLREEDNDEDITGFDLGTARSHRDYEIYAGIDFAKRELSPCAVAGAEPPCSSNGEVVSWRGADGLDAAHAMKWFSSAHCRSGAHCSACRHDSGFRESLVSSGMATHRDFECPFAMDPPNPNDGPGTRLTRMLKRLGFRHSERCACRSMALKMNLWGNQGCKEHIDEILEVMRRGAESPASNPMRLPFVECAARKIILRCVKE